jgi:FADH2 O2-dependent halogenase
VFVSLSVLYFSAASFSETARRLGKPHLAQSFLLHDHPRFGALLVELCERAQCIRTKHESDQLSKDILRAIEPFNVAGLGNPQLRNWYPVDSRDLVSSAKKLEASEQDVFQLLQRCGFSI